MKKKQPTRGVVTKRFTGVFLIILLSLSLVLLPTPVQAYDTWAYPGWQYRRPITITEQSGTDLTYFQVKISATLDLSKVRSDAGDIRFATAGGQAIPYWIESWDNSTGSITVWVKVPSIPANGQVTIYMYYGNPSAVSESDGNAVFEFFDDFEGTSLDANRWTVFSSGGTYTINGSYITLAPTPDQNNAVALRSNIQVVNNIIVEAKVNPKSDTYYDLGLITTENINTNMWHLAGEGNLGYAFQADEVTSSNRGYYLAKRTASGLTRLTRFAGGGQTLQEIIYKLTYTAEGKLMGQVIFLDGAIWTTLQETDTTYLSDNKYIVIWQGEDYDLGLGGPSSWDWVRVRKYAAQEPTPTVGKEQTSTMGKVIFDFKDVNGNPINQVSVVDASNLTLIGMFDDGDTFLIEQDSYTWTFQKEGYHSVNQTVTVTAQTSTVVSVTLVPTLYAQLILHITDDLTGEPLTGVELYINGTYNQTVDDGDIIYLKAGNYILTFKKDVYQDSSVNVEITDTSNPIHIHVYMQPTSSGSSSTTGGTTTWDIISLNTSSYNTTLRTVNISNIYSLFSQWAGGGMIKGLLELNLSKFFEDVFSFNVEVGGKNFSWVGALITSIIWFGGVLVAWFYFKNPLPVIALGRVLYEGLATAKVPSLGYLQYPIAGFMLYMGYLTIKMIFEKWSGEI